MRAHSEAPCSRRKSTGERRLFFEDALETRNLHTDAVDISTQSLDRDDSQISAASCRASLLLFRGFDEWLAPGDAWNSVRRWPQAGGRSSGVRPGAAIVSVNFGRRR